MISARSVSVELDGHPALLDVSFRAAPGEHIALVGPNGAGKSTLLRAFAGVIRPCAGQIEIAGTPQQDIGLAVRAQRIAYLPQQRDLAWDLPARDVAALGRFAWGARRYNQMPPQERAVVDEALECTGARPFAERSMRTLSGGEQARVHLARVLAGKCDVLLLDEPCAALDVSHQLELMGVLEAERREGRLIVTVLHDLELAERFASRLLVLDDGRHVADVPEAAGLDDRLLAKVFGLTRRRGGGFDRVPSIPV